MLRGYAQSPSDKTGRVGIVQHYNFQLTAAWTGSVPVTDDGICRNGLHLRWWAVPTLQLGFRA